MRCSKFSDSSTRPARPHAASAELSVTKSGVRPKEGSETNSASARCHWPPRAHALIALFTHVRFGGTPQPYEIKHFLKNAGKGLVTSRAQKVKSAWTTYNLHYLTLLPSSYREMKLKGHVPPQPATSPMLHLSHVQKLQRFFPLPTALARAYGGAKGDVVWGHPVAVHRV